MQEGVAARGTDGAEPADRSAGLTACPFKIATGSVGEGEPSALIQGAPLRGVIERPVMCAGLQQRNASPEHGASCPVTPG